MTPLRIVPAKDVRQIILTTLLSTGGKGLASDVYQAVEAHLPNLTKKALKNLPYNVRWSRLSLQTQGLVAPSKVRGVWALTPAGRKEARGYDVILAVNLLREGTDYVAANHVRGYTGRPRFRR